MIAKNGLILIINSVLVSASYGTTIGSITKPIETNIPREIGYNNGGERLEEDITIRVKFSPAMPCPVDMNLEYSRESTTGPQARFSVNITQPDSDYVMKSPAVTTDIGFLRARIFGRIGMGSNCSGLTYKGNLQVYVNGNLDIASPMVNVPEVVLIAGMPCQVTLPDSVSFNTVRPGGNYNSSIDLSSVTGNGWVKFTTSDIGTTYPQILLKNNTGDGSFLPVTTDSPNLFDPGKYWWAGRSGGTNTTSVPLHLTVPSDAKSGDYSANLTATLTCN